MRFRRALLLGALASLSLLMAGSKTQAAYTYSTSIVINSVGGTGGTIVNTPLSGAMFTSTANTVVQLTDISSGLLLVPGSLTPNIGNVGVNTSSANPDSFTVNYTDVVTITNPAPGGATGVFTINGTMTFTGIQISGGASGGTIANLYSGTFSQSQLITGVPFIVSFGNGVTNDLFGPPTVNNVNGVANGSLGAQIVAGAVPEPASLAMMGTGLVAVLGLGLGRRMKKA